MKALFAPPARRVVEATQQQIAAVGAWGGSVAGRDPVDGDVGYRRVGSAGRREVPEVTREQMVVNSITSYRVNPMARAIIDTYTAFCVGDSGVTFQCSNPDVAAVVSEFWSDPRTCMDQQEIQFRSLLIMGERLLEMMVGEQSGVVRWSPVDTSAISKVDLYRGNAMWPEAVYLGNRSFASYSEDDRRLEIVQVDDASGLRTGEAMFWTPFKTLETDVRSMPFLGPVLDWLDNYDMVLSNLMDRTAVARWLAMEVTITGGQAEVDQYIASKGGQLTLPPSGGMEVHTDSVKMTPLYVQTGSDEDSATSQLAMTNIAAGTGLSKPWLSESEDANRATSMTMAEPVRRRIGGVQKAFLALQTEFVRFVVDRAVSAGRLPVVVESADPKTGLKAAVRPSQTVLVTGPEVAAADSQLTSSVLLNLATGLQTMQDAGLLTPGAVQIAARKAWEDYMGIPYRADLAGAGAKSDDVASYVDEQGGGSKEALLALVR
jgi:hypothetical protein